MVDALVEAGDVGDDDVRGVGRERGLEELPPPLRGPPAPRPHHVRRIVEDPIDLPRRERHDRLEHHPVGELQQSRRPAREPGLRHQDHLGGDRPVPAVGDGGPQVLDEARLDLTRDPVDGPRRQEVVRARLQDGRPEVERRAPLRVQGGHGRARVSHTRPPPASRSWSEDAMQSSYERPWFGSPPLRPRQGAHQINRRGRADLRLRLRRRWIASPDRGRAS